MVQIDYERLKLVAEFLKDKKTPEPLNFYSFKTKDGSTIVATDEYPSIIDDRRQVIDFIFAVISQDFGFWLGDKSGYQKPIYGIINGEKFKGANFLWRKSMQLYKENPEFFNPRKLARLSKKDAKKWFSDDTGRVLFQDFKVRHLLSRNYGKILKRLGWEPVGLVFWSNRMSQPLKRFLHFLRSIPGYREDPLKKKATLLAMALANRPEHFLEVSPDDPYWLPIVDYHLMRLLLRLGIVKAKEHREKLIKRQWVSEEVEMEIRSTVFRALRYLIKLSNKKMAELDVLLWQGRKYCPEMEIPECEKCLFNPVCEKKVKLFQPVFRTTYY